MGKLSPLMEQYYRVKEQYQDAILLFRIGDFYETFGQDAITISGDLNIILTSRQKDDEGNKIPLAGVPYHALDVYLSRLIKAGHKVAICDQVEDPKFAKGLVKREITRVVTPGTVIEPSMLEESSNNYLAAVIQDNDGVGIAFVDVSTGEFFTTEIQPEHLFTEIAKFGPVECLVPQTFGLDLRCSRIQVLDDACFAIENTSKVIENQFDTGWIEKFRLQGKNTCIRACGAVLLYLHKSHFHALKHLKEIKFYSGSEFMVLDEITLRNLEISKNIRDRSKRGTLLEFLGHTNTPMGARTLAKWIQMPLLSLENIQSRLDTVEELKNDAILRTSLKEGLAGIADLERLVSRVSCSIATPKDLRTLNLSLQKLPAIFLALKNSKTVYLQKLRDQLIPLEDVVRFLESALVDDPPNNLREGRVIREGFDQDLDSIRKTIKDNKTWIASLETKEKLRTGIRSLKIGYTNVFGYYLEISKPNLHLVPADYIRKQTLANCERFITPQLKDMEIQVISAQEKLVALEQEIFERVRFRIAERDREFQIRATALGELDVLMIYAEAAVESSFVKPEFNQNGNIAIRECRHPILDKTMHGSFVPNDVYLNTSNERLIVLTGPNMAGKSTFMRQIALAIILAQAGSFVPASFASLCIVDRIFTRVGAFDDLSAGQSTFMIEMLELANILSFATRDSLVLLDEVGRGTSTFDGLSIAWAISEYLHNVVKCKTIFATHYHQLTQLECILPGLKNYNVAVKEEKGSITFLRTVIPGATDRSYGVHVAKLAGVPEAVTKRATEILTEIEKETILKPIPIGKKTRKEPKYTQLIFFDSLEVDKDIQHKSCYPLFEEIMNLDLDALTPREALNILAEYQKRLYDAKNTNS
ncbi:MAG: DNA mismatch repair protein MutS [Methanotrichaceae archaeon]|nr:DNA mismatch repair protein MutS [Methanotrichaceae archaeon]